jgi:PAS domain S-box-containing protein
MCVTFLTWPGRLRSSVTRLLMGCSASKGAPSAAAARSTRKVPTPKPRKVDMPLGVTLKALRQKQNFNQKALSTLSGVSQATISRIETGRVRQLRSSALKNLADALGVSVDFLMGDNEVFAAIPGPDAQAGGAKPGVREDRFRQIADTLNAFIVHEQGRTLYVNQTFADAVGYRKEELLGKNGIELITAPQSRSTCQRMVNTLSTDPYEVLLVRKDGSVFPAEMIGRSINETIRLAVMHDITDRRCQQAVSRVQQAGLKADHLEDMERVVRIMADEVEDMGLAFEAVGVNVVDEGRDQLRCYMAYPESRAYRNFHEHCPLRHAMEEYSALRGLVSNWRRRKVWERAADEEFVRWVDDSSMGGGYRPSLLVDVPMEQGTLTMGLPVTRSIRVEDVVSLLTRLSPTISCVLKRLQEIDTLTARIRALQGRDTTAQPAVP